MYISPIGHQNSLMNSSNCTKKIPFKANLQLHREVLMEIGLRAANNGQNPNSAIEALKRIFLVAGEKIKPMKPDINIVLGSTRRGDDRFMLYSQLPGAPRGLVQTKEIGSIDLSAPETTVSKIVNGAETLLFGIRSLM